MTHSGSSGEGGSVSTNFPIDAAADVRGRLTNRGVGASEASVALQHPLYRNGAEVCCANTAKAPCRQLCP